MVVVAGNERVEDTVPFDGAAANAVGGSVAMPPAPSRSASVMDVIFLCMSRFFPRDSIRFFLVLCSPTRHHP